MQDKITATILSDAEEQLYPFPEGMRRVTRVSVGGRSLAHSITTEKDRKYIVLLEPLGVASIKMEVEGVK